MSQDPSHLFLSAQKAEALCGWTSTEPNVASLYLPIDESGLYPSILDRLIRDIAANEQALPGRIKDLELIAAFVRSRFVPNKRRGLCVYSCAAHGIFETFSTPEHFSPSLKFSDRPYLQPLALLRNRYYRFLSLQADRQQARFAQIYLGEPSPIETLNARFDGPSLITLALRANEHFRKYQSDRLVLGASPDILAELEPLLDTELRNRLIHESLLSPDRPLEAVVERVRHNELEALKLREDVLVTRFLDELNTGQAVAGLESVSEAVQLGRVKRVLVRESWAKMGRCCSACKRLSLADRSCRACFRPTLPIFDIVAELTDRATAAGIEVFHVTHAPRFDSIGRIGAELSSTVSPRKQVPPTSRALRAHYALKSGRASPLRLP